MKVKTNILCVFLVFSLGNLSISISTVAGEIKGWGANFYGQAAPPASNAYVAVAAGWLHSLALKADGSIVGWGRNNSGQAAPPAGNDFVAVSAGGWHSLALKDNGSIVGWGTSYYGAAAPPAGNDFVAVSAGMYYSLALKADGSIVGWGRNHFGQAAPPAGNNFVAVTTGWDHSLALKADGSIVGWGYNGSGRAAPPAGNDFVAISAGEGHSLALKADGSIVGWGENLKGQAAPPAGNDFVAVSAGQEHSLALKADGSIVGWGDNNSGEAAPPAGNDFVAIAAGGVHSLAIVRSADLLITSEDITFGIIPAVPGEPNSISATVWNRGSIPATNIEVSFADSSGHIGSNTIPQLDPEQSETVSIVHSWPEAGYQLITITVDPNDDIAESDETNNNASKIYQVGEATFVAVFDVNERTRIDRTIFRYRCWIVLDNFSPMDIENVQLELLNVPENMVIVDPNVNFSYVGVESSAISENMCVIDVNRVEAINPAEITWHITYDIPATGEAASQMSSTMVHFELDGFMWGDITGEGIVDYDDLLLLAEDWLQSVSLADIYPPPDGDGIVDFRDFAVLAENWILTFKP